MGYDVSWFDERFLTMQNECMFSRMLGIGISCLWLYNVDCTLLFLLNDCDIVYHILLESGICNFTEGRNFRQGAVRDFAPNISRSFAFSSILKSLFFVSISCRADTNHVKMTIQSSILPATLNCLSGYFLLLACHESISPGTAGDLKTSELKQQQFHQLISSQLRRSCSTARRVM